MEERRRGKGKLKDKKKQGAQRDGAVPPGFLKRGWSLIDKVGRLADKVGRP